MADLSLNSKSILDFNRFLCRFLLFWVSIAEFSSISFLSAGISTTQQCLGVNSLYIFVVYMNIHRFDSDSREIRVLTCIDTPRLYSLSDNFSLDSFVVLGYFIQWIS